MKKILAVFLSIAVGLIPICGITVFAAQEAVTATAVSDWDSAVYDPDTGLLSNGTYGFNVTLEGTSMTVVSLQNAAGVSEVYVPASVEYGGTVYSLSAISAYAFNGGIQEGVNNDLTKVFLPDAAVTVAANVFTGCPNLSAITSPNSITVEALAFDPAMTDIEITSDKTVTLSSGAFGECTALTNVTVTAPTSITLNQLTSAYAIETLEKIAFNSASFVVGGSAFKSCAAFDKIYFNDKAFGEKLESGNFKIEIRKDMSFNKSRKDPFSGAAVEHLTFEEGITTVTETQFRGCSKIKYIDFPSTLTKVDSNGFNGCSNVISLDSSVPDDAEKKVWDISHITSLGTNALNFSNLEGELIVGLSSVGTQAFRGAKCTKVTFVNEVSSLNKGAFYEMYKLKTIVFEKGDAPTFPSSFDRFSSSGVTVIYPDTETESFKAVVYPASITAAMPFGGYIGGFTESAEGGYDVTYAVANYLEKPVGKAIVALYDSEGVMIGAKSVDASVGSTLTTINVPAKGTAASAKIFLLGDISNIMPQYASYEYIPNSEAVIE